MVSLTACSNQAGVGVDEQPLKVLQSLAPSPAGHPGPVGVHPLTPPGSGLPGLIVGSGSRWSVPLPTAGPRPAPLPTAGSNSVPLRSCPPQGDGPARLSPPVVTVLPTPGTYVFSRTDTLTSGGVTRTLSGDETWVVGAPSGNPQLFDYTVISAADGALSETVFRVDQRPGSTAPGLQLVSVESGGTSFAPTTPQLLLPLPAITGATFTSTAVDPLTLTAVTTFGLVEGPARLTLCGQVVDGWSVLIGPKPLSPGKAASLDSRIVGPGRVLTVRSKMFVATAYGGLILQEHGAAEGLDGGQQVASTLRRQVRSVDPG